MTGVRLEIDTRDVARIQRRVDRLVGANRRRLLSDIAGLLESSTRRRIAQDKQGPAGERWANWSRGYAATRHGGKSLLQGEGDLLDSITAAVSGDRIEVGSNLVYAATHQFGDDARGIPARPYLGLAPEDIDAIEQLGAEHVAELLE